MKDMWGFESDRHLTWDARWLYQAHLLLCKWDCCTDHPQYSRKVLGSWYEKGQVQVASGSRKYPATTIAYQARPNETICKSAEPRQHSIHILTRANSKHGSQ